MKSIIAVISLSITCIVLTFFLGRLSKTCVTCTPEIITEVKYIKVKHNEKQIQIKREVEKKISNIPNADVMQLDSIWSEYENRYGKIAH